MNDDRFAPVCRFMVPQVVTALRLVFSSLAIVAAIRGGFDLAAKFIIFGIVTDSLDGPLARRLNVTTEFGALFDYYLDFCSVRRRLELEVSTRGESKPLPRTGLNHPDQKHHLFWE